MYNGNGDRAAIIIIYLSFCTGGLLSAPSFWGMAMINSSIDLKAYATLCYITLVFFPHLNFNWER